MIVVWLIDLALLVLGWFLSLFSALPTLSFPSGITLTIPIPFVGTAGAALINAWFSTALLVSVALALGKVMQWLYSMIPFKGT